MTHHSNLYLYQLQWQVKSYMRRFAAKYGFMPEGSYRYLTDVVEAEMDKRELAKSILQA